MDFTCESFCVTVYPFHYNKDYNYSASNSQKFGSVYPFHYNKDYNSLQ